jgi:hypothetical protein
LWIIRANTLKRLTYPLAPCTYRVAQRVIKVEKDSSQAHLNVVEYTETMTTVLISIEGAPQFGEASEIAALCQ